MELFSRIAEGNGWVLSATGIGTVFFTLICIWLFLSIYSKLADRRSGNNRMLSRDDDCTCAEVEPLKDPIPPQKNEEAEAMQETETKEPEQVLDDTLPKMAAAAAVAAHLKRRKSHALAPGATSAGTSPWISSGRVSSLHNLPPRNPWKGFR